jgi:catechol 2,3-dioxygenase-like lactoylglutathione lyase family enzyme
MWRRTPAQFRLIRLPGANVCGVPERIVWAIQVLREQRGGIHPASVHAAGLSPLEAIMATEGEGMASMYGWERPYLDPELGNRGRYRSRRRRTSGWARPTVSLSRCCWSSPTFSTRLLRRDESIGRQSFTIRGRLTFEQSCPWNLEHSRQPAAGRGRCWCYIAAVIDGARFVGFVPVGDPVRARRFYVETLGLPVIADTPFALVLDAGGASLRVTPMSEVRVQSGTTAGWLVEDIKVAVRSLTDRGVVFARYDGMEQDELGIWTAPDGGWVAWFQDPDGNTLSVTQAAK